MGPVTRRTLAALLVAVPAVTASVTLPGVATAFPAVATQAGGASVETTADNKFSPVELTVAAGTKITWTMPQASYHTVTGGDGTPDQSSPIGRGVLDAQGKTYSVTISEPGTYAYFCEPHVGQGMKGTVVVTAGGAAATTAPAAATSAPAASSAPPASASASATVGAPQAGAGAPTAEPEGEGGHDEIPGVAGNDTLEAIEEQRAAQQGAVSGFRFFAAVATAFLFILGAAVMFSTRPRRAGR